MTEKSSTATANRTFLGNSIFHCEDELGRMDVVDHLFNRSLHFDSKERQSCMSLTQPDKLVLAYTKFMMAVLVLIPPPRRVLCAGLGGGSIPKFLSCHFPASLIDIVELREKVARIAYDYFFLPRQPNMVVHVTDAGQFLADNSPECYDLIILDAFTQHGVAASVSRLSFMENCSARLSERGALAVNLWSDPKEVFLPIQKKIAHCFGDAVYHLPVAENTNQIFFALKHPIPESRHATLLKRAKIMEKSFQIGLPRMTRKLLKKNTDKHAREIK